MRPQALALSPDGKILVTSGKTTNLVVIDPASGKTIQTLSLSTNKPAVKIVALPSTKRSKSANSTDKTDTSDPDTYSSTNSISITNAASSTNSVASTNTTTTADSPQLSYTGLVFAPNGKRVYLANTGRNIRVFAVDDQRKLGPPVSFAVPDAKDSKQKHEIPSGLAVSDDSQRLYVVGNLGNKLHELDAETGRLLRSWNTGLAPYDVVLVAGKAYVSNMGGRRPGKKDLTAPAGKGSTVRVDPVRHIANEGSVTVVDLAAGAVKTEILVELHASALAVSPDHQYVVVANTGSDTLSVIATKTDRVIEKIWTRQTPADLFGAQPNALAFDSSGKRLYVCNATQNAVAVVQFEPEDNASAVIGMIPVGWFPGAIAWDASRNALCVANIKGIGAMKIFKPGEKIKLSSKDSFGTVSLVPAPSDRTLAAMTLIALRNMCYPKLAEAQLPPRAGEPLRPVPERTGEPSVFKHVIYVIKENRSYDQVLGDMKEGNGDASLCTFGQKITPNQHKIAREFVLLDNTYCAGVQSADGHQWTDSGIVNAYMERQASSGFPRSYPSGKTEDGLDALAWSSSGFIWDNALAHGKTFCNFGEWMLSEANWRDKTGHKEKPRWVDFWEDYKSGANLTRLASRPGIATLRNFSPTNTVGWDLNVPDVMRAAEFIKALKQAETNGGLADFTLLFLPNDHTGGTRGKTPTPAAQIADNDLAMGQIVEALSHSPFWADTCLFAIEDDPQAGWDHVSGYRTTCYVVSPYTKRRATVSTRYNQLSLIRTMELILGLPPMNQLDAIATPMSDVFMASPDMTPFDCVPNSYPLDTMNPEPKKVANPILRKDALVSAKLRLDEADRCPEDVLNQILWRAMKGTEIPYPTWAVKADADKD
jgi:YVTN family beta-propeller protein